MTTTSTTRKKTPRSGNGWQAEKSAMTRKAILDAAIECFIELGYAKTTTALIAEYAGVSRGAMMHHFPSRLAVIKAATEYLHELRLEEYKKLMAHIDEPEMQLNKESVRASVDAAWKYVNLPSFIAYEELMMASRTDAELNAILQPIEKAFESQFIDTVKTTFPHWEKLEVLDMANDLVQFLMRGMALSHMASRKQQRARRMMDYLAGQLEQLYHHSAEINSAKGKP